MMRFLQRNLSNTVSNFFFSTESAQQYHIELGNFKKSVIKEFRDLDGQLCGIKEYLNSRGLFLSKTYFYILTRDCSDTEGTTSTETSTNLTSMEQIEEKQEEILAVRGDTEDITATASSSVTSKGKIGQKQEEILAEREDTEGTTATASSSVTSKGQIEKNKQEEIFVPVFEGNPCKIQSTERQIKIKYTKVIDSSYSLEIVCTSSSYNRAGCLDNISLFNPEVLQISREHFCPMDYGYKISAITIGDVKYFSLSEDTDTDNVKKLLRHGPDTLWGYDENELIIAATSDFESAVYTWYRDGKEINGGVDKNCIAIYEKGTYTVVITQGEFTEVSKPLNITAMVSSSESEHSDKNFEFIPIVESSELNLTREEEYLLGEGGFGKVYKGKWNGTDVAVKEIRTQLRNRSQQESLIKNEVGIHARIRHPNIVQIMCISYTQKSVLLVSEFVDGCDLETAIFDKVECLIGKEGCYGRQICQGVAYLHGRNPQIIHQDIKPSNVLINPKGETAKLCDLGLSKLKLVGAATTTCASSVPGTLMYMAPEGMLNRKTYVQSDIWALGCTLLELITKEEVWNTVKENDPAEYITEQMKLLKIPHAAKELPPVYEPLKKCFDYDRLKRPSALELIELF